MSEHELIYKAEYKNKDFKLLVVFCLLLDINSVMGVQRLFMVP